MAASRLGEVKALLAAPDDQPEDDVPALKRLDTPHGSTLMQAAWNTVKPFLGAGIFAFPWAVRQAGMLAGTMTILAMAALAYYTITLLLRARALLVAAHGERIDTYDDLGYQVARRPGRLAVQIATVLAMIGVAGAYLLFVAQLLAGPSGIIPVSHFACVVVTVAGLTPALWLEDLGKLSRVSAVGVAVLLASLFTMYLYGLFGVSEWHAPSAADALLLRPSTYPLALGAVAFMYTSHPTAFPVARDMQDPEAFPRLLRRTITAVTVSNVAFAAFGFLVFGDAVQGIVILNMTPSNGFASMLVRIGLSVDLLLTFPLAVWPVVAVLEANLGIAPKPALLPGTAGSAAADLNQSDASPLRDAAAHEDGDDAAIVPVWRRARVQRRVLRSLLALSAGLIALATPSFEDLASLLGSVFMSQLAYVFPPLFFLRACRATGTHVSQVQLAALYGTVAFGVLTAVLGSVSALTQMIHDAKAQSSSSSS